MGRTLKAHGRSVVHSLITTGRDGYSAGAPSGPVSRVEEVESGEVGRTVSSEPEMEWRKGRGMTVLCSGSAAELSLTNHRRCEDTAPYPADLHIKSVKPLRWR